MHTGKALTEQEIAAVGGGDPDGGVATLDMTIDTTQVEEGGQIVGFKLDTPRRD